MRALFFFASDSFLTCDDGCVDGDLRDVLLSLLLHYAQFRPSVVDITEYLSHYA